MTPHKLNKNQLYKFAKTKARAEMVCFDSSALSVAQRQQKKS